MDRHFCLCTDNVILIYTFDLNNNICAIIYMLLVYNAAFRIIWVTHTHSRNLYQKLLPESCTE